MLIEILLAIIIGLTAGIITGLTPGIHINLISLIVLSLSPLLLVHFSVLSVVAFILAMSVAHTFLDVIPSIFLGAPDDSTALGVLPGHRMLIKGNGLEAIKFTVIGSFGGLLLSILLFIPFIFIVRFAYDYIAEYIGFILIAIIIFMLARDRNRYYAIIIFLCSGLLGMIIFAIPNFTNPLFPLLSGLFGVSTLLYSIKDDNKIPEQKNNTEINLSFRQAIKALLSGEFSGFLTAVLPGVGASTAAVIAMQITRDLKDKGFLVLIGAISTVNFTLSLVTFYVLEKARNGSVITISKLLTQNSLLLTPTLLVILICIALLAGSTAVFLTIYISRMFCTIITKVNYQKLTIGIILLITLMTIILTGPLGLLVLIISTALGLVPAITKTTRTHAMGCLLLPVVFYFL